VKFREGFRPFAPAGARRGRGRALRLDRPPHLHAAGGARAERSPAAVFRRQLQEAPLYDRLYFQRSHLPAVTHVDYSARIQTVSRTTNPRFWELLQAFKTITGCGVLVNTSFNVRGEPIVCTPDDAYRCFMRTDLDFLVIGDYLFDKAEQPPLDAAPATFAPD
jgi:carbamoyltransferase